MRATKAGPPSRTPRALGLVVLCLLFCGLLWAVTASSTTPARLDLVGADWDGHLVRAANLWGWAHGGRDTLLGAFGEPAWWEDPEMGRRYPPLHALLGASALELDEDIEVAISTLSRGSALLLLLGTGLAAARAAPARVAGTCALAACAFCLGSPTLKGLAAAWPLDLSAAALLALCLAALAPPLHSLRGGLVAGLLIGLLALTKTAVLLPLLPLLALQLYRAGAWCSLGGGLLIGLFALRSLWHPIALGWPLALLLSAPLSLLLALPGAPSSRPWGAGGARVAAALALFLALPWHLVHSPEIAAHFAGHPVETLTITPAALLNWTPHLLGRLGPAAGWILPALPILLLLRAGRGRRAALLLGLLLGAMGLVSSGRPGGLVSGAYQERLLLPLVPMFALLVAETVGAIGLGGPYRRGLSGILALGLSLAALSSARPNPAVACGPPAPDALFRACPLRHGAVWGWRPMGRRGPEENDSLVPFAERTERVKVIVRSSDGRPSNPGELGYTRNLLRGEAIGRAPPLLDPATIEAVRPYVDEIELQGPR